MIYISYMAEGTRRDTRIVDAETETRAAVQGALGATQNVNVHRAGPVTQEMSADEAARDFLAHPDLYGIVSYDPYMRSIGWNKDPDDGDIHDQGGCGNPQCGCGGCGCGATKEVRCTCTDDYLCKYCSCCGNPQPVT